MSKRTKPKQEGLQLLVQTSPNGETAATVPVRWKITPELAQRITDKEFVNPHIVLAVHRTYVRTFGNEVCEVLEPTSVDVVPLTREMQYVNFVHPGINMVTATIIDVRNKYNVKDIAKWMKYPSHYPLNDDGTLQGDYSDFRHINVGATVRVQVPSEMFAPEPAAWRKRLVGEYFSGGERDQCHFRKRFWFAALPLTILIQLLGIVLRPLAALGTVLVAHRDVRWKALWGLNPIGIFDDLNHGSSWWLEDKNGQDRKVLSCFYPPFIGIGLLIAGVLTFAPAGFVYMITSSKDSHNHVMLDWSWWHVYGVVVGAEIALAILITIGVLIGKAMARATAKSSPPVRTNELMLMAANTDTTVSVAALPRDKQTVVLRFSRLKAQVCRPFAR